MKYSGRDKNIINIHRLITKNSSYQSSVHIRKKEAVWTKSTNQQLLCEKLAESSEVTSHIITAGVIFGTLAPAKGKYYPSCPLFVTEIKKYVARWIDFNDILESRIGNDSDNVL